ncbi:7 transmembrane sweet-taste receptor of 3 GCPR-domain-containing protein [Paraphysoderma sedebokerense]|nr:7 transmembrane sweet-taste receptor of 3 GCPR-domain-containing protein [Paraphysoderma sedebokerense]
MMIFTPNAPIRYDFSGNYYDTRRNNASDVGLGLVPGRFTFLGGSGAIMTKKGKQKNLAWKLLKLWGDTTFGAINYLGMTQGTIPPYESAVDVSPWNTEAYAIGRLALKRAVPPQYPMTTFPQFAELEARKPFRLLLAEMIYKNITAEEAINRACQIVDHVFLPKCSSKHIKHELSSCFQNGSMVLSFQWDQSQPCRDGIPLPEVQTNISCTHLPMEGPQGISLMTINSALMLYILFAAAGFTVFRNRASIKRAGYLFSQCTIFGAAMCSIAVYLGVGPPTVGSCVGYTSLLTVGFAITFASFITKLYRIYLIFSNNKGIAKLERSLSDTVMFRYLIALVAVEALLLALWVIVDQPGVSVYRTYVQDVGTITTPVCKYGSTMTVVLMAYNGMLLLLAAVFAFKVRKVPSDFNETKAMVFAVYSVTFIIAIVVPTTTQLNKPQSFQTIVLFVSRFSASATKGSLSSEQNCIHCPTHCPKTKVAPLRTANISETGTTPA